MALYFKPERHVRLDPSEVLTGTCMTCKTVVSLPRYRSQAPKGNEGMMADTPSAECPSCKARVFLTSSVTKGNGDRV